MYSIIRTIKINHPANSENDDIKLIMKNNNDHKIYIKNEPDPPKLSIIPKIKREIIPSYDFYNIKPPITIHGDYFKANSVNLATASFQKNKPEVEIIYNLTELEDTRDKKIYSPIIEEHRNNDYETIKVKKERRGPGHQYAIKGPHALTNDIEPSIYKIIKTEFEFEKI